LTTTVVREIPFCSIKFPLWEFLKVSLENHRHKHGKDIQPYESILFGTFASGFSAALTLPIDLAYKKAFVDGVSPFLKTFF
jgi:solute carrier family 25 S-adenosylmethionine transporter 26